MFKITQLTILIVVVILFIYKDSGFAAVSKPFVPDPTSPAYQKLVEMRKNVGLDTSPEAMNRLYAEQGPNPGFARAEDRDNLAALSDIEAQIPNIQSRMSPANNGGIYIKSADHKIVVKWVHGTPELKENMLALAKFPESILFEEALFTKTELENAQKLLTANMDQIPNIASIGVDIMGNRLDIGFNLSEQQTVEIRKQMEKLLNPQMLVYSFDVPPITF